MIKLLCVIIAFIVIIKIFHTIVSKNKEGSGYKRPKRLPSQKSLKMYKPTSRYIPLPENEEIVKKWDKAFLKELEWKLFEEICMEYLRLKNCDAKVTSIGADGGMDIKVSDKCGNVIAVAQCKAWDKPIGVNLVRELYGVMAAERVKHGIFLTTSIFSDDAKAFAAGKALILIDGEEFVNIINGLEDEGKKKIDKLIYLDDHKIPTCVNCNIKLVKRTTKKGLNAGREFWGCINYPKCKVTMHIRKEHKHD
ncbi:MAG: restriction endonuclease [Methylococcales bacterium]|nr:restriction endonuclease [Methylococcales bacterium]